MATNDWKEHKKLILDFKDKTEKRLDDIDTKLEKLLVAVVSHKVKTGVIYGGISLIVSALVSSVVAQIVK